MDKNQAKSLNRRLMPLYISAFFQGFVIWYATEKLFMKSIGFNNETIAIETVIFTSIMLLVNTPAGIIADRWSRKGILILGSTSLLLSSLLGGLSNGFWPYVIAISFWGIYYACYTGINDSVIYDVLIEKEIKTSNFNRYYGRLQIYDGIALIIGSLINPLVTHFYGLRAAYFLSIPFTFLAIVSLLFLKEPKEHKKGTRTLIGRHITDTIKAIIQKGEVLWIVFTMIMLTILSRILFEFDSLWFIALALPLVFYGPVNALELSSISTGGFIAGKLKNVKIIYLLILLEILSSITLLTRHRTLIIFAQTLLLTGTIILDVILNQRLHDKLPSKVRAGSASLVGTIGYIAFLPVALLFGYIANRFSVLRAAWVPLIVLMLILLGLLAIKKTHNSSSSTIS